jgi:hypothetical protein
MESSTRHAERELVFAIFSGFYPKFMFDQIAHADVVAVLAKTAMAVFNDDSMHKLKAHSEFLAMRLGRGVPFEQGAEALWDKVAAVEAMRYPIVSGMDGEALMHGAKEGGALRLHLREPRLRASDQGLHTLHLRLRVDVRSVPGCSHEARH